MDKSNGLLYLFGVIGVIALIAGVTLYSCWASAFVAVYLWSWFIVPVFGLPLLTMPQAFGFALLVGFLAWQYVPNYVKDEREWSARVTEIVVLLSRPWITLLFGWLCKIWFL